MTSAIDPDGIAKSDTHRTTEIDPHRITEHELANLGLDHVAFIKLVTVDDEKSYAIHAADGTRMGMMNDRDTAFATVRQHGLDPVAVH